MIVEEKDLQVKEEINKLAKDIHKSLLGEGGCVYLNTSGWSMYPFMKGGDRCKLVGVGENDIKTGDIIAVDYKDKGRIWFYVHRLIKIYKDNGKRIYITKGDIHRSGSDEPVGFERIAGKVTEIKRKGLRIDLERPLWRFLNKWIARLSLRYPRLLPAISPYISLLIEWRQFPSKLISRIKQLQGRFLSTTTRA